MRSSTARFFVLLQLWLPGCMSFGFYGSETFANFTAVTSPAALIPSVEGPVNFGNFTGARLTPASATTAFEAPPVLAGSATQAGTAAQMNASPDPALGLQAIVPYGNGSVSTTVTQHFLVSGLFTENLNISLVIDAYTDINSLPLEAITAWSTTFLASTTLTLPGAAFDITDAAVSTAIAELLQPVVTNTLSYASAVATVLSNFTVSNATDLDATVHFASNTSSSAPNATLTQFLAAVLDGTFSTNLHAAAAAALSPSQEGGGGSTIPAASLQPLQTVAVSVAAGTTTLLPTVDVQLTVTSSEPNSDGSFTLSASLQQSVASGQLASVLSSAVGYPVYIAADDHSSLYIGRATLELGTTARMIKAGSSHASIKASTPYNQVLSKMMRVRAFEQEMYTPAVVAVLVLLDSVGVIVLLSLLL